MRNLREKKMDVSEKKEFIGKVISGEVSRLSDDDMTVISELECDIGHFDIEDLYEYGSDELSKKLDDFGFDEVMLEYGVICLYDN
tara:strand:- start:858 stop:1112 length:255 start_codon:yes stop_codon:yes gene_type:complete